MRSVCYFISTSRISHYPTMKFTLHGISQLTNVYRIRHEGVDLHFVAIKAVTVVLLGSRRTLRKAVFESPSAVCLVSVFVNILLAPFLCFASTRLLHTLFKCMERQLQLQPSGQQNTSKMRQQKIVHDLTPTLYSVCAFSTNTHPIPLQSQRQLSPALH